MTDGWLIRINGGAGEYTYQRTAALNQRATFETGEVMAGYQWYLSGGARFSAYFGAYAENHDNTDPLALIHGSKGGVKGQVEYYTPLGDRAFAFVMANATLFERVFCDRQTRLARDQRLLHWAGTDHARQ